MDALVIPFFIPHAGCPFKCVFCNQWEISGREEQASPESLYSTVLKYLETAEISTDIPREVAFFGGTFTGLPQEEQNLWLKEASRAKKEGLITGIRLSTRPDYITNKIVENLMDYGVTTVELGVQSLVNEVLKQTKRGYYSEDVLRASEIIRTYPLSLGYQLMLGLPGDTKENAEITAARVLAARPDMIRIYPTVVLKGTELAKWYKEGYYSPWTIEQAVEVGASWYALFTAHGINVIRMGLQANDNLSLERDLLAGPYQPAYGEMVLSRVMLYQLKMMLSQVKLLGPELMICFNPRAHSKVVGHKRTNLDFLYKEYKFTRIQLQPNEKLGIDDLGIQTGYMENAFLSRQEFFGRYRM